MCRAFGRRRIRVGASSATYPLPPLRLLSPSQPASKQVHPSLYLPQRTLTPPRAVAIISDIFLSALSNSLGVLAVLLIVFFQYIEVNEKRDKEARARGEREEESEDEDVEVE